MTSWKNQWTFEIQTAKMRRCLYRPDAQSIYVYTDQTLNLSHVFLFSSIHFQCFYRPDAQTIYLSRLCVCLASPRQERASWSISEIMGAYDSVRGHVLSSRLRASAKRCTTIISFCWVLRLDFGFRLLIHHEKMNAFQKSNCRSGRFCWALKDSGCSSETSHW